MRIKCPFCGQREASEFSYLGSASVPRPDPSHTEAEEQFVEATYFRDNPCGPTDELWFHLNGCRQWLKVTRDTRTHAISAVRFCVGV